MYFPKMKKKIHKIATTIPYEHLSQYLRKPSLMEYAPTALIRE